MNIITQCSFKERTIHVNKPDEYVRCKNEIVIEMKDVEGSVLDNPIKHKEICVSHLIWD